MSSDPGVFDESDAVFAVRPRINVTSPTAGQNIYVTNNLYGVIQWNITGTVSRVDIRYDIIDGSGGYPYLIAGYVNASLGQYDWNDVPKTPSAQARIRVVDNSTLFRHYGVGNSSAFNILGKLSLTSPAGGENFTMLDNTTR